MKVIFQTEGVVLRSFPVKDFDRIVTLFTPEEGLLKLYLKSSKKRAFENAIYATPYTVAQFFYTIGKGQLGQLLEGSLVDQHLKLRDDLDKLEAAEKMTRALLSSQSFGKSAPALYALFCLYLKQLCKAALPKHLETSFIVKLFKHEGLLDLKPYCSTCGILLKESYRICGERFCKTHSDNSALHFDEKEEMQLLAFSNARSFQELEAVSLTNLFSEKISLLFSRVVHD